MLSKLLTIGPITALHYHDEYDNDDIGNNEEKGLLFFGIGGILNVIRNTLTSNSITNSFTILETDSIFGIKSIEKKIYKESNLLVYGGKSIAILEFNRNINEIGVNIKCKFNELDDLVLDSSIVYDESNILLVIGYAHNFIDIVTLADTEVKSNINKFFKRRVQCSELCCLFSLALNVDDINNIIIVSGTVFGKIIIWKVKNNNSFDIIHRLSGHEGVIFNIKWNETKDKIVTVSDDRSVRVWDIISGNVLFIGWGHICRPWDSIFVTNIDNKDLIVTSSEEGTLKVWDINENKCICNLRGHACDIWRLIYLKEKHTIISGGNDGSIKIWYLLSYLLSCPDNIESTSKRLSIPKIINTHNVTDNDNNSSRRNNGICFLRISNDGRMIVVGFVEGRICTILNSSHSDNMIWNDITTLDKQITCGDICFKSDKMIILCGHIFGTISLLDIDHNKDQFNCVLSNYEGHPLRIINIWIIETDDGRDNSIMFLSASVKGHNKLWNILTDNNKNHNVESVSECFTVSKQVATCSIIINSIITKTTVLVIGDSRGNISIYCSKSLTLLQYVAKAHGPDQLPVSYLHSFSGGFYSLGHDGFLNRYEEVCDIGNESILLYKMASKLSCLPLKTPDQLIVSENKNNTAIYACGYLGNVYIVWDIRNGHQLMRIEGGSWKRAHHCILSYIRTSNHFILPRIVFSCPIPCGMNTDLIINDSLPLFCNDDDIFDKFTGDSLSTPLQVGYPSLGKVGYCTVILNGIGILSNEKYILIGGEEGTVKVYRMLQQNTKNNFVFCEDLLMPFNAAVRCMDKLDYNTDYGYVIAGGGRLTYSIWKYLYRSTAGLNNFSLVCCGTILPNASQDHRILSISSYNIDIDNESKQNHFIAFGDSRGIVTISNIEDSALDLINEVQISSNGYPVLSSKTISYRDNSRKFVVGAFGDTSGNISILLLYYSDINDEKCIPVRLYKYNGHSMGTNTVDVILHNDESNLLRFKICSGGDDQSITICNGTIHFENSSISKIDINSIEVLDSACGSALKGIKLLNSNDKWKSDMIISIGYDRRLLIWLHNEDNKLTYLRTIHFVDAIDQYNILLFSDENIDKVSNHKLNLKWLFGTLVDIGDIGSLDVVFDKIYNHNETKYRVSISVIGEGLQYFSFDM